jgi:hypothetical protein
VRFDDFIGIYLYTHYQVARSAESLADLRPSARLRHMIRQTRLL